MCELADFDGLTIVGMWRTWLELELEWWHRDYLPLRPGSTVLDVGAGCGETAQFYLNHGAGRVIAIESEPEALSALWENFSQDPRVEIVAAHLDRVKVDIEGAEEDLDLEIHFPYKWEERRNISGVTQQRLLRLGPNWL